MRAIAKSLWMFTALAALTLFTGMDAVAQEEDAEAEEHGHDNVVALFLGGATHLGSDDDPNETGFSLGVEYERRLTSRLKLGLLAEYALTDTERNYIAALPLFAHLTERLVLVAAPGIEWAVEDEGTETHEEADLLMRFGTIYEVEINNWVFAPQVHGDLVSGHWTLVYGLGLGIGF